MKKLICEKDVEKLARAGETCLYVDRDTLVTTAAKDLARSYRIEITDSKCKANTQSKANEECNIDSDELLRHIMKAIG